MPQELEQARGDHLGPLLRQEVAAVADGLAADVAGERLRMPLLVLWGAAGLPSRLPVLDIWREYATDVRGEALPDCGHFLAEERPAEVAEQLLRFLDEAARDR